MLTGFATLDPGGMADFFLYLTSHGLIKGALFMVAGIVMSAHQDVDEIRLYGKGRDLPVTAIAFGVGGLLLAGLPFGPTGSGHSMIDKAVEGGHAWLPYVLALRPVLTGAAVLRAGGRIFLGLDPKPKPKDKSSDKPEGEKRRPSALMLVPVILLLAVALGLQGHFLDAFAAKAAHMFMDHDGYASLVLEGKAPHPLALAPARSGPRLGWAASALAVLVAAFGLFRNRLPRLVTVTVDALGWPFFKALDRIHTGHVGDYAAWATFGLVLLAAAFLR